MTPDNFKQKLDPRNGRISRQHVHKDIAALAMEACQELYERVMGDNLVRAEWKRQNPDCDEVELLRRFVQRNWGKCVPFARATMARLLATSTDDALRESVLDALLLDNELLRGRGRPLDRLFKP